MTDWTNDPLDQLAFAVEANTTAIAELRVAVVKTRGAVNSLLEIATLHQQNFETSQCNFEVQAEIRGLQTENRRILDRLFGQNGDDLSAGF